VSPQKSLRHLGCLGPEASGLEHRPFDLALRIPTFYSMASPMTNQWCSVGYRHQAGEDCNFAASCLMAPYHHHFVVITPIIGVITSKFYRYHLHFCCHLL